VSAEHDRFRDAYAWGLHAHLRHGGEDGLRAAYELGRQAVVRGLGVLDVVSVHHEVLVGALEARGADVAHVELARAAGDFLLEGLGAFEMVQRGFAEAQAAALAERRQAEMLRQLSTFLADASLALAAADPQREVLQLVAEQARELVGAEGCVASVAGGPEEDPVTVAALADAGLASADAAGWAAVPALGELAAAAPAAVRLDRAGLAERGVPGLRSWLAAPLHGLDGRALGLIQVLDKRAGEFTVVDEAIVVHLAQMAAAALDRARLYRG
jgi:GAF domain-containing protein